MSDEELAEPALAPPRPGLPAADPFEVAGLPAGRGDVAFRLLVEAVEDYAIFLLGPDGRVLTWNLGAQRIKGYTADEIIGEHFSRFYVPEEREANRPMKLLGLAADHGRFEDEGWRVRKDGTRFWADVIVTALRDEHGRPYAYAKVTRDLTERREAEERQRRLLVEQEARAAAEEALRARDRFLSIASHELKTPTASLGLTVDSLLRARAAGRLDEERLETGLARLRTATERLGVLVDELLDVARLTSDRSAIPTAPVDLVAVARDVADRFADAAQDGRRIELRVPAEAWVTGDVSRLDQVITNLVDNALKYSAADTVVEIEIVDGADGVALAVLDRGVGLDDVAADRLFEAFGRGGNVEGVPGLGLGLFIAHGLVERHDGRLEAGSRADGPGAAFRLWLPKAAAP